MRMRMCMYIYNICICVFLSPISNQVEKKSLMTNLDLVLLSFDEMVDHGYVCVSMYNEYLSMSPPS